MNGHGSLQRYRVERYLPGMTKEGLRADLDRVTAAARALAGEGARLRYLGSTFAPEEESCFCRFDSESRAVIEEVCLRAGLGPVRVTVVEEFPPGSAHRGREEAS